MMSMKVCYWGTYDQDYSRNKILISGLRKHGVEVVECHAGIWRNTAEKLAAASSGWSNVKILYRWFAAYLDLIHRFRRIHDLDAVIIGYSGHFDVFVAKLLSKWRKVPLIFDAFLSLSDSLVQDRKIVRAGSLKAHLLKAIDRYACHVADVVLLDTQQHIDFFVTHFGLLRAKFRRLWIGADDTIFFPQNQEVQNTHFTVLHFGKYIPLHGMSYIIQAAKQLEAEPIHFQLIGSGDEYADCVKLAHHLNVTNIEFIPFLAPQELTRYIRQADLCLGIFGDTEKAHRVVPNKVYEAMAMKKPVLTGDSPAAREILRHDENCCLCAMHNPEALAEAILRLQQDERLRATIAGNGYQTFTQACSPDVLGAEFKTILMSTGGKA